MTEVPLLRDINDKLYTNKIQRNELGEKYNMDVKCV